MKLPVTVSRAIRFAVLAGAVAALTVTPAAASQGQPVLAGQVNTETASTVVANTAADPGDPQCGGATEAGLTACGSTGVEASGTDTGVAGVGTFAGVQGIVTSSSGAGVFGSGPTGVFGDSAAQSGTGVRGFSTSTLAGIGVEGESDGPGSGVYGLANAAGVGVFGDTTGGTGVLARSTNGTALDVRGKVSFSRSGLVTVTGGAASKKVTLAGITSASMILATAQQDSTVSVRSAVPASGSFTLHLTGKAPAGGLKVAYFVLG
jgi:hypothetical protein